MRIALLSLAVLLAAVTPTYGQDYPTTEARKILDAVSRRYDKMKPGDRNEAAQLVTQINAAKAKLRTSGKQGTDAWNAEVARANELDKQVRARMEESPAGSGSGSGSAPTPSGSGSGEPMPTPPPAGSGSNATPTPLGPLSATQRYELKKVAEGFAAQSRTLQREPDVRLVDEAVAAKYAEAAAKQRALLGQFAAADHPDLAPHYGAVAAFEKLLADRIATAKAAVASSLAALAAEVAQSVAELDARPAMALADAAIERAYRAAIESHRTRIGALGAADRPDLAAALANVVAFERRLDARAAQDKGEAEAKGMADQKQVDAAVKELVAYFDPKTFTCDIAPPYTEARVREWVEHLKASTAARGQGAELLDKLVAAQPAAAEDARVKQLRWWFAEELPRRINRGIGKAALVEYSDPPVTYTGVWPEVLKSRAWILEPSHSTPERLANDQHVADLKAHAAEAIEAGQALLVFRREFEGKPGDAEVEQTLARFEELLTRIAGGAEAVLASARLPATRMHDEALEAAAVAAIERGGWSKPERLVLSSDKPESRQYLEWEGQTLYRYDFDQVYVHVAEQVAAATWIVQYRLRFYRSANSVTTLGKWVVTERIQSRRILPENIGK